MEQNTAMLKSTEIKTTLNCCSMVLVFPLPFLFQRLLKKHPKRVLQYIWCWWKKNFCHWQNRWPKFTFKHIKVGIYDTYMNQIPHFSYFIPSKTSHIYIYAQIWLLSIFKLQLFVIDKSLSCRDLSIIGLFLFTIPRIFNTKNDTIQYQ